MKYNSRSSVLCAQNGIIRVSLLLWSVQFAFWQSLVFKHFVRFQPDFLAGAWQGRGRGGARAGGGKRGQGGRSPKERFRTQASPHCAMLSQVPAGARGAAESWGPTYSRQNVAPFFRFLLGLCDCFTFAVAVAVAALSVLGYIVVLFGRVFVYICMCLVASSGQCFCQERGCVLRNASSRRQLSVKHQITAIRLVWWGVSKNHQHSKHPRCNYLRCCRLNTEALTARVSDAETAVAKANTDLSIASNGTSSLQTALDAAEVEKAEVMRRLTRQGADYVAVR